MRRVNSKRLLPFARQMRKQPSEAEQKLWQLLRSRQLEGIKFRRQHPAGPFIADFACEEPMLIVEVDGDQHSEVEAYDDARTQRLNNLGWRVVRFSAYDVTKDIDAVLATILDEARQVPSPGNPGEG